MRVITGTARGSVLFTPDGNDLRPTSQRVKEALFSAVQFYIPGARVLDLFAGSGQLGIEALSRGASRAVFVDGNEESVKIIKKNLIKTGFTAASRVVKSDAFVYLARTEDLFDIIFIDPPYGLNLAKKALRRADGNVDENGIVLCETEYNASMPDSVGELRLKKRYDYSRVAVWLYEKGEKEAGE